MKVLFLFLLSFLTVSDVVLETRTLLDNKIEILIPKGFQLMPDDILKIKYPKTSKPKLVLTDENYKTNIAFNHTAVQITADKLDFFKDYLIKTYQKNFPNATIKGEGITTINGNKVAFIKIITTAIDQNIYNHIFLTEVGGTLLIGTFNCLEKDMAEWEPISEKIVASLKVSKP